MNEEVVERLRGLRSRFSTPFYENASYGYGGFVHEHDSKAEEFIQMSRTSVRAQKQAAQVITQVKSAAAPTTANAVQKEMVDKEDKDKLSTAKRKRSSSDTRIALLSPSLPPIFDEALARGKISPAPALLSPTLPPKFITPKQPSPSPDSTDLARTTSRLSETGKSEATMSAGTDPPKSTPAHNTTPNGGNQDLSALAKLMSTKGRECKHLAQSKSPHSKLYGVDAVLCFLAHYHLDEVARIQQSKAPSLALIRSLEEFLVWVSCLKTRSDVLQNICHFTLATMHYHTGRTEQKHAKLLLKAVEIVDSSIDATIKRDLFELMRKSMDSAEKASVWMRKTGNLLDLPFLKKQFPGVFVKLQEEGIERLNLPSFTSPVSHVINFCRALLEEMPETADIGGLKVRHV